jgi:two-component system, cell cycle response regulator
VDESETSHDTRTDAEPRPPAEPTLDLSKVTLDTWRPGRATRDQCTLVVLTGPAPGAVHPVAPVLTRIGRSAGCEVRIEDAAMSRVHARIEREGDSYHLIDERSRNGTFLNGIRIETRQQLRDGDRIQLGIRTVLGVSFLDVQEQDALRRSYEHAVRDALTAIYNRRFLDEQLGTEHAYASRHRTPLSVLLLDLDHFKQINDAYGHLAGDEVLASVARCLGGMLRKEDVLARYGGEEFAIVARGIEADGAMVLAERLRAAVEAMPVTWRQEVVRVTASIGVVIMTASNHISNASELLLAADRALYEAKRSGRNRVCSTGTSHAVPAVEGNKTE